jgi:hypothetical protein
MSDLSELFATIAVTEQQADIAYFARRIPAFQNHRVAKDRNGNPCLLLSVADEVPAPPVVLQNIALYNAISCRILLQEGLTEEETFSILTLRNPDRFLQDFFLNISGALLEELGQNPASGEINDALNRAVELFRALSNPGKKTIQGLWAEVFLIWQSRTPGSLTRAWHSSFDDRFDFSAGAQRLEVKSSRSRARTHRFSLEQLKPPAAATALVASVFVEPAGAGSSIRDLSNDIQQRLPDPDLVLRLGEVITSSLGSDWSAGFRETFDLELAQDSLQFYDAREIPSVNPDLPPDVSDVSFQSNLQNTNTTDLAGFDEGIFSAARKR